jgi:hypothetical protein
MGTFNVKHGCTTRWSAVVSSSESTNWSKGRVLMINTAGQIVLHDGGNNADGTYDVTGIAMETRVSSTSVGPNVTLTKVGQPSGARFSMILSPGVIIDDQIRSGISFEPGDSVYVDSVGRLTTSGTRASDLQIGKALNQGRAGDGARPLEFYFQVNY